jgi:hypothetical protein
MGSCTICSKEYEGSGNNAQPLNEGQCCDKCNNAVKMYRIELERAGRCQEDACYFVLRHTPLESLKLLKNVQNIGVGIKMTDGIPTDDICVVFMVSKKLSLDQLDPKNIVPSTLSFRTITVSTDVMDVGGVFDI